MINDTSLIVGMLLAAAYFKASTTRVNAVNDFRTNKHLENLNGPNRHVASAFPFNPTALRQAVRNKALGKGPRWHRG